MLTLTLNTESTAVMLRCLSYGESAISENEEQNGTAAILRENIQEIRRKLCKGLADELIASTVSDRKSTPTTP